MSFDFSKYVKLWPWLQFVGLELIVAGLVFERWHPTIGGIGGGLSLALSAFAFVHIVRADGWKPLLQIRRLLQVIGYVAIIFGFASQATHHSERGALFIFVGTGVAMAGIVYDLIYP